MARQKGLLKWLKSDDVLSYIIDSYAGEEPAPANPRIKRRTFIWQEGGVIVIGNAEAFLLHLAKKYERECSTQAATYVHRILRNMGESVVRHPKHSRRDIHSPRAGKFRQPEPDTRFLRHAAGLN